MSEHPKSNYSGTVFDLTAGEASNLDERGIPKQLGSQMRKMEIAGYDPETHTVTMAVSSSTPVERYFGLEILSHEKGAIRTDRLKNGLSLLYNHNMDDLLGRSQSFELGDPLRVVNKFGPGPMAKEREADVEAGILVDVSLRYVVNEWEITEDKNGVRTYLAVDWEPLETSLVTIPADPTVGVGRSLDKYAAPVSVRSFRSEKDEEVRKDEDDDEDDDDPDDEDDDEERKKKRSADAVPSPPSTATSTQQRTQITMEEPQVIEKARVAGLRGLRSEYGANFSETQFMDAVSNDTTVEAARTAIANDILNKAKSSEVRSASDQVLGNMSEKEAKQYSLRNAIVATINARNPGTFKDKGAEAGFEREVSDSLKAELGKRGLPSVSGIVIPSDLGARSLQAGGNAGQNTINTVTRGDYIEMLRARCRVMALGASQITVDTGLLRIPRQNGSASSQWLAELGAGTNSDATLDAITFSPKRNGIVGSYTLEMLAQSAISVEAFMRADQLASKARTFDAVSLIGTGGNMPLGLLNMTGLAAILTGATRAADGTVTGGTGGKPVSFVDVNAFEAAISNVNGDTGTMGWMYTPRVRAAMRSTAKFPGTGGFMPLLPDSATGADGLQEGPLGYMAGVTTNGLPTNGTVTVNSVAINNLHTMILGVWSNLIIASWGVSELVYDNITQAKQGIFQVIENEFMDVNCTHIEGFAASTTVLPS